jgi:hypothetical protein
VDYYGGNLWRTDWGAGATYTIVDSGDKRSVMIDPAGHTYSVHTFTPDAPKVDSSRTVTVEIEVRDTGEQRQMFGHVIHHILTIQRRHTVAQGRSMAGDGEMTIDGWYMDLNLPSYLSRANSVVLLVLTKRSFLSFRRL